MTTPTLRDIGAALRAETERPGALPCHIAAFRGWIGGQTDALKAAAQESADFTGQARHPEHVAALDYGHAAGLLDQAQQAILADEIKHLAGRAFFAPGRPRRFEVDGIALLGVAVAIAAMPALEMNAWCGGILRQSLNELRTDAWQHGLVCTALIALGETNLTIHPPDLAVAAAAKGHGAVSPAVQDVAWASVTNAVKLEEGAGRDAVRLAAFELILARAGQVRLALPTRDDLVALLRGVERSLKRWTYERAKRTPNSAMARWDVENEYHVQNLLWAVIAPAFPDVDDEENLPSIGQTKPRADLGIASLRTLVEVKFLRDTGQAALRRIIEEIAADTSLYLSRTTDYDNIVVFVWDDCAQTEQHHELTMGIETIRGVAAAIIVSRPSSMRRQ